MVRRARLAGVVKRQRSTSGPPIVQIPVPGDGANSRRRNKPPTVSESKPRNRS